MYYFIVIVTFVILIFVLTEVDCGQPENACTYRCLVNKYCTQDQWNGVMNSTDGLQQ